MEVIRFLIVLTIFCQNAITARQNLQINGLIFDLTRPINELIGKNISQQDFRSDIHSAFDFLGVNMTTSTVFYKTAGSTLEELELRTKEACETVRETLNINLDSQLLISWFLKETIIDYLNSSLPYNHTFDGCSPKLILHFNNDTGCDAVPDLPYTKIADLFESNDGMFVGVSFDESMLGCNSLIPWNREASILVLRLKFGTTKGVTESFGLFQTRMKFLSENVKLFYPKKPVLYYPTPYSVGNDEHQNLLIQYASIWTISNKTQGSMLLQVPNSRNIASEMAQFSIIPTFALTSQDTFSPDEDILSTLLWFAAGFQRYQMIFVNEYIWKLWNSLPEKSIRPPKMRSMVSSIDLILDCSWFNCGKLNGTANQLASRLNAGNPTTFVFNVEEERLPSLPQEIAGRLSPKSAVGCMFANNNFKILNESNIENVVRSCQSINGSVYILSQGVTLEWYLDVGKYSFFFENTIRKELHSVNRFRRGILKRVPSAKVYFELITKEQRSSNIEYDPQSNSLFCDELMPSVNLYFEGIFNWAKLENFPVIKRINNEDATSYFLEWCSVLRRLNYPYPDWAVNESKIGKVTSSVSSTNFLMRDYLKSIHNWEPDACIDWTEKRWEIEFDFFHNPKIGTVFHPNSIINNQTPTRDDYITMLQFMFHRFRSVEISISFDFSNILAAFEDGIVSFKDFNVQIFMNYGMTEQDNQKALPDFTSFIDQLKRSKVYETGFLRGVHSCLVFEPGMNSGENISNLGNFESVLSMMKDAKLSNLSCGIELSSVIMCNQMLQKYLFADTYLELFGTVNYLVCKENFSILTWSYTKLKLQNLLDSHLALKRTLDRMIPHLRIYFRVEFDLQINFENHAELDRYTSFLTLFKTFGTQYDISYFVGVAFDSQSLSKKNGWWGIKNYSDLTNPQSYVEKVTVSRGHQMWYPTTKLNSDNQDFSLVFIVSSVSAVVVFFLVMLVVGFGLRYRKLRHLSRFLSDSEVQEFLNGRIPANTRPVNMDMELIGSVELEHMKFNQQYNLNLSDMHIDFEKILGSGAFGMVYKGLIKNIPAAIKRPNADCSKTTFKSVLTEAKVLSYLGKHSNIVGFLGAYVNEIHKGVLYISTELCSGGSLEAFLRTKSGLISQTATNQNESGKLETSELCLHELNTFAMEIAQGMEYIESKRVVHGDLATRNVLLDENMICKIGDFGLSRKLYEYQKYVKTSQEPLPWKWMAPESLTKMEFTSKSDVWSYGVTIWEIYSLGKIPYAGLNWSVDFVKDLQNGLRLTVPDFAPENIFSKMLDCWKMNPDERPTFEEFIKLYKSLGESAYTVLDLTE